jgi:hypothetical protein
LDLRSRKKVKCAVPLHALLFFFQTLELWWRRHHALFKVRIKVTGRGGPTIPQRFEKEKQQPSMWWSCHVLEDVAEPSGLPDVPKHKFEASKLHLEPALFGAYASPQKPSQEGLYRRVYGAGLHTEHTMCSR